jgi:hypothetical protein
MCRVADAVEACGLSTPVPVRALLNGEGQEGEFAVSPPGTRALAALADLKHVYRLDYDLHGFRDFGDDPES